MMKRLVRVLSTGRTGTKFITSAFQNQEHAAFHEEIYAGEPSSAIIEYMKFLASMWRARPDQYFAYDSNYGEFYVRSVMHSFAQCERHPGRFEPGRRSIARRLRDGLFSKPCDFILDAQNRLTPATPLLHRHLVEMGIDVNYIILLRNPVKTIHAIYMVEGANGYGHRAPEFCGGDHSYVGAARVWSNTYDLIHDQRTRLGSDKFFVLQLERFAAGTEDVERLFNFLGISFDRPRFDDFRNSVNRAPLRAAKTDSQRNSDLFRDPEFSFSSSQIEEICATSQETAAAYGLDMVAAAEDYRRFHGEEKKKLSFV